MNFNESTRKRYSPLHSSGIDAVDSAWGGLFRGGAYLVYGESGAGRNLLTLLGARAGAELEEQTILISSDRYSELTIQAGSLGFNLEEVLEAGYVHLVRIPPRMQLRDMGDDGVAQALQNLIEPYKSFAPNRIIVNDFMPFVAFRSFERFRVEFVRFLESTDELGSTLVLAMSEPANDHSRRVIDFMVSHMTGGIHLQKDSTDDASSKRILTLIPTSGHIKGFTFEHWDLEDIVVLSPSSPRQSGPGTARPEMPRTADVSHADSARQRAESAGMEHGEGSLAAVTDQGVMAENRPAPGYSHTRLVSPIPVAPPQMAEEVHVADATSSRNEDINPSRLPVGSGLDVDITDRRAFLDRLERAVATSREIGDDFTLLALRLERPGDPEERAIGFEFLLDVVHDILKPHDDMLADMDGAQLLVYLAHTREQEAEHFFARIKDQMIRESPEKGSLLLTQIGAVVCENGKPFTSMSDFVTFALSTEKS